MKSEPFTEFKTGRVVPITDGLGGTEYAFVPNRIPPPAAAVPDSLWPLLARANGEVLRLDGVGRTLPNPRLLLTPLQRREALRSSSIEGTIVSPKELLLFEALEEHGREPKTSQERDWLEVFAYYEALRIGHDRLSQGDPLDRRLIKKLHHELMATSVRGEGKSPGEFREVQNHVGRSHRFTPPPVEEMEPCIRNLEEFLSGASDESSPIGQHPLIRAYIAHYQFEAIHPFRDGNGRIGRLLLSLTTMSWLGLSMPWLYMSEFFDEHRSEYIEKLLRISTHGEWADWLEFCLNGTIQQAKAAMERCENLRAVRKAYLTKVSDKSPRMHKIIDMLFSNPILTVPEVKNQCGIHYVTAAKDLQKLVDAEVLVELDGNRPRAFAAMLIMRAAYS